MKSGCVLLLTFTTIAYSFARRDELLARQTKDGFIDFRGLGINEPKQLLTNDRGLIKYCCIGYNLAGSPKILRRLTLSDLMVVTKADFSHNNISSINGETFNIWNSLISLRLEYNGIAEISENAFSGLCLEMLSLKGNKLRTAKFEMPCEMSFIILDLSYNYILNLEVSSPSPIIKLDCSGNLINNMKPFAIQCSQNLHLEDNKITHFSLDSIWAWKKKSNLFLDRNLFIQLSGHLSEMNLEKLSISSNKISSINPTFFDDSDSLKFINISFNQLTEIRARTFSDLKSLETLDLSENKITQISIFGFQRLLNLTEFFIDRNPISQIPSLFLHDSTKLKAMEIVGSTESPDYFDNFPALKQLKWSNADRASWEYTSLLSHLRKFELRSVAIENITQHMDICNISTLESLSLNYQSIATVSSKMMNTSSVLVDLSLANNDLQLVDLDNFPASLVRLNLSNNFITEVLTPIRNHLLLLRILDLQNNLLTVVPAYIYQHGTQLDFTNLYNNRFVNYSKTFRYKHMKTKYLCFRHNCVYLNAMLRDYSVIGLVAKNSLKCECHSSIRNFIGFSKRRVQLYQENLKFYLFKYYVMGCIKEASVYYGSELYSLHYFASLASELSSLYLYGWNLSIVDNFHLECSPQIQRLAIIKSDLIYINETAFSSVPHLQQLDLSENKLTKFEFTSFQYMPKINRLNLSQNLLTTITIPQDMPNADILQLEYLDLSHNHLSTVDFGNFQLFSLLKTLYLFNNDINATYWNCLLRVNNICQGLPVKIISLANNYITRWTLSRSLAFGNAMELDLSFNRLIMYEEVYHSTCSLSLRGNLISEFQQKSCRTGQYILDISQNQVVLLSDVKFKYPSTMLNASRNLIIQIRKADTMDKLTLTELYVSHNLITLLEDGCFSQMTELVILDLSYNQLRTFDGVNVLMHGNSGLNQYVLRELNLEGNSGLNVVTLAVKLGLKSKLSISKLCSIVTHGCPFSGAEIEGYLQTPTNQRTQSRRPNFPIDIEIGNTRCTKKSPLLAITCTED